MKYPSFILALLLLYGCTLPLTYRPPPEAEARKWDVVLDAPSEKVWQALLDYAESTNYRIVASDRDIGLLVLRFDTEKEITPNEISSFIDCGKLDRSPAIDALRRGGYHEVFMVITVDYKAWSPADTQLRATLSARVSEEPGRRARVRVNAGYVFRADASFGQRLGPTPYTGRYDTYTWSDFQTWSFSTSEPDTKPFGLIDWSFWGFSPPRITCRSAFAAEKNLLNGLKDRLSH